MTVLPYIQTILEQAIHAPSGENCQPWRFVVSDTTIEIWNIPERDTSLYSWGQRASYFAHGALIENISISAAHAGYKAHIHIFPNTANPDVTASIELKPSQKTEQVLYSAITARVTNRKPYKKEHLSEQLQKEIFSSAHAHQPADLFFTHNQDQMKTIAQATSANERIIFENDYLHDFFYSHITWTKEEDQKKQLGFFIDTFELPPPVKSLFQLCQNNRIVPLLKATRLTKLIASKNAHIYASASGVGVITIPDTSPHNFLTAGRLFQRIWLESTYRNLSMQPLAGMIYLMLNLQAGNTQHISSTHQELITRAYNTIRTVIQRKNKTIAMIFRIGYSGPPSARALRLAPIITTRHV
jgi:hypothetical protein